MNTKKTEKTPMFQGTRVPILIVVEYILIGWDRKEIKKAFPSLNIQYIDMCIAIVNAVNKLQTTYDKTT